MNKSNIGFGQIRPARQEFYADCETSIIFLHSLYNGRTAEPFVLFVEEMRKSMALTIDDVSILENLYEKAKLDCKDIEWINYYPEYPESISAFFRYITSSSWCNRHYKPGNTSAILKNIGKAELADIQSALTSASRGERFCTGLWIDILKEDQLSIVIERAKELLKT